MEEKESEEKKNGQKKQSFWATLPGILTGCAAIIGAIGGLGALITALVTLGLIKPPFATSTPPPLSPVAGINAQPTPTLIAPTVTNTVFQPTSTSIPPTTTPIPPTPIPPTPIPPTPIPPTATSSPPKYFLETENRLPVGEKLQSANGKFTLQLQTDGNLVLYKEDGVPIWASHTDDQKAKFLVMQADGNLVLYGENVKVLWASETASGKLEENYIFQVNDDGNLVIYHAGVPIWASNTGG